MTRVRRDPALRFWEKVEKQEGCWLWQAATDKNGYGKFRDGDLRDIRAHRWAYIQEKGEIPAGLVLDHLCRTPACVNPAHLRAVTNWTNIMAGIGVAARNVAKTHCPHGHPYAGDNLTLKKGGGRRCRACAREDWARRVATGWRPPSKLKPCVPVEGGRTRRGGLTETA